MGGHVLSVLVADIFHEVTGWRVEYVELYEVLGVLEIELVEILEAEVVSACDEVLEAEMGVGVEVVGLELLFPTLTQ